MSGWDKWRRDAVVDRTPYLGVRGKCPHPREELARHITVRGVAQVGWWCFDCHDHSRREPGRQASFLKHSEITVDIDTLPIAQDNRRLPRMMQTARGVCDRCGELAFLDRHHWAPKHLFADADDWPMANLCRNCHMEWHRVVTPNMNKRGAARGDD